MNEHRDEHALPTACEPVSDRWVTERVLVPMMSEMRGAILGAVEIHEDGSRAINVELVRRWLNQLMEQLPR